MTEALYLQDSYLQECAATVRKVTDGRYVVLDKTMFYAVSGGQPWDEGSIEKDGEEYKVKFVKKFGDDISHEVDKEGLQEGDQVTCKLDWERRYKLMRSHSAAHVLAGVFCNETGASLTGGQLGLEKCRCDLRLEEFSKEKVEALIGKANEIIVKDLPIKVYTVAKAAAVEDQSLFKLEAKEYIEHLPEQVRIVDIEGFDRQADGGTHVKSLKEIGTIVLEKIDNKGKHNRRIYLRITT